jgi:hypothetical protein
MTTSTTLLTAFGQILAVVDHALGGLSASAMTMCMSQPTTQLMGLHLGRATPTITRNPALDAIMAEAVEAIDPNETMAMPAAIPTVDQGVIQIAYYQTLKRLPARTEGRGRSKAPAGVDWSTADWSKSDAGLSREFGVSRQAVAGARKRHQG